MQYHETEGRDPTIGAIALLRHNVYRKQVKAPDMDDVITRHISKTPGVCGGRACIAGHRIRVMDIVLWHQMRGYSPDEIVSMFPGISLGDVHAALAYYFDNLQEIKGDFAADEIAVKEILAKYPSKLSRKRSPCFENSQTIQEC